MPLRKKKTFENIMGKGENAEKQQLLILPQCFLRYLGEIAKFESQWDCRVQMLSIWSRIEFDRLV